MSAARDAPPPDCCYCRRIATAVSDYPVHGASYDLGSPAPRCGLHWRYPCAVCRRPKHFMSLAFCPRQRVLFCADCAGKTETVDEPFWAWEYYFRYRSPWSGRFQPSLDRLEFEGRHPGEAAGRPEHGANAATVQPHLDRAAAVPQQWPAPLDDSTVRSLWNRNALPWESGFDADGDDHRAYVSDEPMLAMLGPVRGADVLDLGCGNGYLCRKLAHQGARVVGVDLSEDMLSLAARHEAAQPLGITYLAASATQLAALETASFDKIVCNHVLTSVPDHESVLDEARRVLRPEGRLVLALSHPCFSCGPRLWDLPAADSPRQEEASGYVVDDYFRTGGNLLAAWEGFAPVPYVHRPLSEYWRAFRVAGFLVSDFAEPSVSSRGRAELPGWQVRQMERIPYSCLFLLTRVQEPLR